MKANVYGFIVFYWTGFSNLADIIRTIICSDARINFAIQMLIISAIVGSIHNLIKGKRESVIQKLI